MTSNNLAQFVQLMKKYELDSFVIDVHDEYQSEYPKIEHQRLCWLCGFTGSAGTLIISSFGHHHFFTDGRYTTQASNELKNSEQYIIHDIKSISPWDWLKKNIPSDHVTGYDPKLFTVAQLKKYGERLRAVANNPIDDLWHRDHGFRSIMVPQELEYSGKTSNSKCSDIIDKIQLKEGECLLISNVLYISWLLNVRSKNFFYTPSIFGRAILYNNGKVDFFIEDGSSIEGELDNHKISILPISQLESKLSQIKKIHIDETTLPVSIFNHIKSKGHIINSPQPIELAMAKKNDQEIKGFINSHIRDGVAVTNFLYWLDQQINKSSITITEISAAIKLIEFRNQQNLFRGESFATISAFAENAAIIHYHANSQTNKIIHNTGLYLLDSGGQYLDGTTDVTRTILIGNTASAGHKNRFTRVLKGHIALANAIFPLGTTGGQLDILARHSLWQDSLDYPHGTGHGVGSYLAVHEGPHSISSRNNIPLEAGMVLSNEPGYYESEQYGIRIENMMYVAHKNDKFLCFKQLTCVPIDLKLIDFSLLTKDEKAWLQWYHTFVYENIAYKLDIEVQNWLKKISLDIPKD